MAELSPQAQAVLDAAYSATDATSPTIAARVAAAALRAAAAHLQPTPDDRAAVDQGFPQIFLNGVAYAANELRLIAHELEQAP